MNSESVAPRGRVSFASLRSARGACTAWGAAGRAEGAEGACVSQGTRVVAS